MKALEERIRRDGVVKAGNVFGIGYKSRAELAGGTILLLIGSKILIEHLFL